LLATDHDLVASSAPLRCYSAFLGRPGLAAEVVVVVELAVVVEVGCYHPCA
jgi:hypothetical protein